MNAAPLIILYVDPLASSHLAGRLLACGHLRRLLRATQADVDAQRRSLLRLLSLRSLHQVRYSLRKLEGFVRGDPILPEPRGGYHAVDFCGVGLLQLLEEAIHRSIHRCGGKQLRAVEDHHLRALCLGLRL